MVDSFWFVGLTASAGWVVFAGFGVSACTGGVYVLAFDLVNEVVWICVVWFIIWVNCSRVLLIGAG